MRAEINGDDWLCEVNVDQAGQRTRHLVTVTRADLGRWGDGITCDHVERLVARSFDFLLEREPPNAVLASFDLAVIESYFPDYDNAIRRHRR